MAMKNKSYQVVFTDRYHDDTYWVTILFSADTFDECKSYLESLLDTTYTGGYRRFEIIDNSNKVIYRYDELNNSIQY